MGAGWVGWGALLVLAGLAGAEEPCPGFNWDVSAEHALFMTAPAAEVAGKDRASAPTVAPGRLVQLQLAPSAAVSFAATPGRSGATEDSYAGLALLAVAHSGAYRVSVNQNLWIDVVVQGRLVPPLDYEGSRSCDTPHKIVVFHLAAGKPLVLQFSGAAQSAVRVTVTPAPGA
ncbi:MAG TPA: hypothetical protein VKT22_15570 [Steroidobacteraceae bacterium]|nr:hypothetical protein [Steroidobacteraceae bacterium]